MNLDANARYKSQAISYTQAVAEIFYAVLEKKYPLDKELKSYFRQHGECGSRDRYAISESCFSLFRWFGWLDSRLPKGMPAKPFESQKFCHALAAALWLEGHNDLPFFSSLIDQTRIDVSFMSSTPNDIQGKIKGLGHFFKLRKLDAAQLIPEWFVPILPDGTDVNALIDSLQRRPPVWIRIQNKSHIRVKKELEKREVVFFEHPHCLNAIRIQDTKFRANEFLGYQSGDFEIQDLASQCIGLVCQAKTDHVWWDVCAGAGGKSLMLADEMQGKGRCVATDIREDLLDKLKPRARRGKFKNISVSPIGDVCASTNMFDGVLVDAPCSCTGIWRRNPDLKWTTKVDACMKATQAQLDICEMASKKVKKGGVLVYATCSLSVEENENCVRAFLKKEKDFQLEGFANPLNGKPCDGQCRISFQPFDNDGMFVARLRKS